MSRGAKRVEKDALAARALYLMEENKPRPITSLFVFEAADSQVPVGVLHIHDLLKAGVV
jgi:arabinose-5-phosphate isomerase